MTALNRIALLSLLAALLLGILGDQLFFTLPTLGLGSTLWVAALALATLAVVRSQGIGHSPESEEQEVHHSLTGEGRWLLLAAVLFATGLLWRASPLLQFLDLLAIGICLGLAALTLQGGSLGRTGVLSYPLALILSAAHHISGPMLLLLSDIQWNRLPKGQNWKQAAAVLRGLLIALPLLLIFGGLFAAADAIFEGIVTDLFTFDSSLLVDHLFRTLFFGALAAGFLRTSLLRKAEQLPQIPAASGFALGPIETGLILGLLNLLFLGFVLVQVRYLFGGTDLVLAAVDMTYAEYARRGFFELVQVSALVLPTLLGLHWLIPQDQLLGHRLFRWLGRSLVALLFVIMASALHRMWLYLQEYGLTELRLYTTAFMGWMILLFIGLLITVLRGQRERFALWALTTGLLVLGLLHTINPDGLIVRTNLARLAETGRFDLSYVTHLSPDATPALVKALPDLAAEERRELEQELHERQAQLAEEDWRSWNWGRTRARKALSTLPLP